MRNTYSEEFESEMRLLASTKTLDQLLAFSLKYYNYKLDKEILRRYLSRRKIRYKGYMPSKQREKNKPIGSEMSHGDGLILVKTDEGVWTYKQRYIYEKYYNVKLPRNIMVIFLDGDRSNYNIDNLMAVDTKEYLVARNKGLLSKNPDANKTAMLLGRMYYKLKDKQPERVSKGEEK